jgi:hypothetical protein
VLTRLRRKAARQLALATAAFAATAAALMFTVGGSAVDRSYGFEPGNCTEFAQGCQGVNGGSVAIGSGDAFDGSRYQIAADTGTGGTSYARGVDNVTVQPGEEIWFGAAIRPARGFYDAANGQVRLIAWDTYPASPYMRGGIWVDSNDRVVSYRHVDGGGQAALVVLGARAIPEGVWTMVEIRQRLSTVAGQALTEVYLNGQLAGSSTAANLARNATITRFRVGLGDSSAVTNPVRVDSDRAYIANQRKGTTPPPPPPPPPPDPEPAPYTPVCAPTCDEQIAALAAQAGGLEQRALEAEARAQVAENKLAQIRGIVG